MGSESSTELTWAEGSWGGSGTPTAKRKPVSVVGEPFVTTTGVKNLTAGKQDSLSSTQLENIASVPGKRVKADNACYKDSFSEWKFDKTGISLDFYPKVGWVPHSGGTPKGDENSTSLHWNADETGYGEFTATRSVIAAEDESFITTTGVRTLVSSDTETRTAISLLAEASIKVNHNAESTAVASVTLKDGDVASVTMSGTTLAIDFDDARADGGLRLCELYISGATKDADLTFAEGETVVTDGNAFPKCEAGLNYYVFAEVAPNTWNVTRKTLQVVIPAPTTEG